MARSVTLISRLRPDAQRYAFPDPNAPRRRGPQPWKGQWLTAWKARVATAVRDGTDLEIPWYGGTTRRLRVWSEGGLWHTQGQPPVAIRWVLVVDPTDRDPPLALFSTDLDRSAAPIVARFVLRWNGEVTVEETRRHRGVETPRQWSDRAIARTTPAWFAPFSLGCLMAHRLVALGHALPIRATAWYRQSEATFSDRWAMVRRPRGAEKYFPRSLDSLDPHLFHPEDGEVLLDQLASTA